MRFEWTPSVTDLTLPFFVGLGQLLLVEAMTPERISIWFGVLALFILLVYYTTQAAFRRARHDPHNNEFFAMLKPATWRDHLPNFIYISMLVGWSAWLYINPGLGWISTIALITSALLLLGQLRILTVFWRRSMGQIDIELTAKSDD
jgi:hypothetical protein